MESISTILEDYKVKILKEHTLICYLFNNKKLTSLEITKLLYKHGINLDIQVINEISSMYELLLNSSKLSQEMKNSLEDIEFLNNLNFNELIESYFWANDINIDNNTILITKRIEINNFEALQVSDSDNIQQSNDSQTMDTIEAKSITLETDILEKEKDVTDNEIEFISLDKFAEELNMKSDQLLKILKLHGWLDEKGIFRWTITRKSKDYGVKDTFSNINIDKIWPLSLTLHYDFKSSSELINIFDSGKGKSDINNIKRMSNIEHENEFIKYVILAYLNKIDILLIENIVEDYYRLYGNEESSAVYEEYFDKYSILYEEFDNIKNYFTSVDQIREQNSSKITNTIESASIVPEIDISVKEEETIKLISLHDLKNEMKIKKDVLFSILQGLDLIVQKNNIWSVTLKAELLGVKQVYRLDKMSVIWPISIIDFIEKESQLHLKKILQDFSKAEILINNMSNNKKEFLLKQLKLTLNIRKNNGNRTQE